MREYCIALTMIFVFQAAALCQEDNNKNIESDLSIDLSYQENETKCDERTQFSSREDEVARLDTFIIDISNRGEKAINDVTVLAIMPKGMKYASSSYDNLGGGRLEGSLEPPEFNETQNTSIEWNIGSLQTEEIKSIFLRAYLKCSFNKTQIELAAIGSAVDDFVNDTNSKPIYLKICNCTSGANGNKIEQIKNINVDVAVYEPKANDTKAVFSIGRPEQPVKLDIYNITITNNGDIPLDRVEVNAIIPEGMMLKNTGYSDPRSGRLNVESDPVLYDENSETNLKWNIGSLLPEESKSIILEAYLKYQVDNASIPVMVEGYSPDLPDNEPITDVVEKAIIKKCENRGKDGRICAGPVEKNCTVMCPDWQIR